jgi:hypothetical protein
LFIPALVPIIDSIIRSHRVFCTGRPEKTIVTTGRRIIIQSFRSYLNLVISFRVQWLPIVPHKDVSSNVTPGEFFEKHYKPVLGNAKQVSGYFFWESREEHYHTFRKVCTFTKGHSETVQNAMSVVVGESIQGHPLNLVLQTKSKMWP